MEREQRTCYKSDPKPSGASCNIYFLLLLLARSYQRVPFKEDDKIGWIMAEELGGNDTSKNTNEEGKRIVV